MTVSHSPRTCTLFNPGHHPHWIQMRLAREDSENMPMPGRLRGTRDDGSLVVTVAHEELTLWNHDVPRLVNAVEQSGGVIHYQRRWGLLFVPSNDGQLAYCVIRSRDNFVSCRNPSLSGDPIETLRHTGGVTIPLDALRSHVRAMS
jgi:hypothetical protein